MVNIAVLGYGVVGSGVVELIKTNYEKISSSAAQEVKVKYILDVRSFPDSPYAELFVDSFEVIENDPQVQIVVETIGGTGAAYEYTKRSILAGKSVVTSNKELVAVHGQEILELARQKNLNYLFEASVGGGIPILRPISQCLSANEIYEIYGILNGTTNYILSQMLLNGSSFEKALENAKAKGYAEADPTADIKGIDTCRKICILADLAFGSHINPDRVPTYGIENITEEDMAYAKVMGAKIKLVGRALRREEDSVVAYVAPHILPESNLLSNVEDVFNCIVVRGNAIGDAMFYGKGAGKLPTASAVVADVIDAAKHFNARKYIYWEKGSEDYLSDPLLMESRWFIRAEMGEEEAEKIFGSIQVIGEKPGAIAFTVGPVSEKVSIEKLNGRRLISCYRILD